MASPPKAAHTNETATSESENVPVIVAATAKRMHMSPEASSTRDSPSRICCKRRGIGVRRAIAETAVGSVGDTMAASAKATASGIAGISQ
jgi:hypothetical protein